MCVCIGYIKKMELCYLGLSPGLNFFGLRFSQLWGLCKFWDRWCGIRREGLRRLMDLDWSKNWCFCLPFLHQLHQSSLFHPLIGHFCPQWNGCLGYAHAIGTATGFQVLISARKNSLGVRRKSWLSRWIADSGDVWWGRRCHWCWGKLESVMTLGGFVCGRPCWFCDYYCPYMRRL